jgi:hypothetical protein
MIVPAGNLSFTLGRKMSDGKTFGVSFGLRERSAVQSDNTCT